MKLIAKPKSREVDCVAFTAGRMDAVNGTWNPHRLTPRLLTDECGYLPKRGRTHSLMEVPPYARPEWVGDGAVFQTAAGGCFAVRVACAGFKSADVFLEVPYAFIDALDNPDCLVLCVRQSAADASELRTRDLLMRIRDYAPEMVAPYTHRIGDWWLEDPSGARVLVYWCDVPDET